jgi:hypothetical protein
MWMGEQLCEYRGYGEDGWSDTMILDYFQDLVHLHDMFIAQQNAPKLEELEPAKGASAVHPARAIRVRVRHALSIPDAPPIAKVLSDLGLTAERFTQAVSMGRWSMSADTLNEFEQAIMDPKRTLEQLSYEFGISTDSVTRFRNYWSNRPTNKVMRGPGVHPYQQRMRELINQGVPNKQILATIQHEFNIQLGTSAVSKMKSRMRDNNPSTN